MVFFKHAAQSFEIQEKIIIEVYKKMNLAIRKF